MQQQQFQTNYSKDKERKEIVQRLFDSGRVYFFPAETETGFVLVSNLSTAVLVCLQDLYNPNRLDRIIDVAMEYPLTEVDTEVLQAISHLRLGFNKKDEKTLNDTYNLLALYCYLADMVTLYPNNANPDGSSVTFLQACREGKLTLKLEEEFVPNIMQDKFRRVLTRLGLLNKLPNNFIDRQVDFIDRWVNNWEFEAFGEVNSANNIDTAAYNQLARAISLQGAPYIGVGECISYARGNRDHFEKEDPEIAQEPNLKEIMLSRALNLAHSKSYLPILIERGKKLRRDKLETMIREHPELQRLQAIGQNNKAVEYGKNFMRDLLLNLPIETLQIIDSGDYSIAHANQRNLENIYPKDSLPSFNHNNMSNGRLAAADTLSRYRMILDSNGLFHPNPPKGVLQQRYIHETTHIAFGYNGYRKAGDDYDARNLRYEAVRDNFANACANLLASNDPAIEQKSAFLKFMQADWSVDFRKLREIINVKSTDGTYTEDARKEEMMVECLALAYTEFANSSKPNNIFTNYRQGEPAFDNFRAALAEVKQLYHDAAQRIVEVAARENQQQQQSQGR